MGSMWKPSIGRQSQNERIGCIGIPERYYREWRREGDVLILLPLHERCVFGLSISCPWSELAPPNSPERLRVGGVGNAHVTPLDNLLDLLRLEPRLGSFDQALWDYVAPVT